MTQQEIDKVGLGNFDILWKDLGLNKNKDSYLTEYETSKQKFSKLLDKNSGFLNLDFYVKNVVPSWTTPEWGFPKGRRNGKETNYNCALREFEEETGFKHTDYSILDKIKPVEESLIGTNGIFYKHVYYVGLNSNGKVPKIDDESFHQANEIGDIGWFTYDETINLLRPYHTDRQKILTHLYLFIINNIVNYEKSKNQ